MEKRRLPKRTGTRSEINVTPLIDIVLVLLIVFIVMVPSLSRAHSASLPSLAPPPPNPLPFLMLTLASNGTIQLQNEAITDQHDLESKLIPMIQRLPINHRQVFLKVEGDAAYQSTVQLLDSVRASAQKARLEEMKKRPDLDISETKVVLALKQT